MPACLSCRLQLTQKKSLMQFKTLDSVLQTLHKETGDKQAITYRCADIDRIVPSLMGVSKVGMGGTSRPSQVVCMRACVCACVRACMRAMGVCRG